MRLDWGPEKENFMPQPSDYKDDIDMSIFFKKKEKNKSPHVQQAGHPNQ